MLRLITGSLLRQLLGVYLIFVLIVLGTGAVLNAVIQDQLGREVQVSTTALAQAIALETDSTLRNAQSAMVSLSKLETVRSGDALAISQAFQVFKAGRPDIERIDWLGPDALLKVTVPPDPHALGQDFAQDHMYQRVQESLDPIVEAGNIDPTTRDPVITVAAPMRDSSGLLLGVVASNILLDDLSAPLQTIVAEEQRHGKTLLISIVDNHGQLIAAPQHDRLLQPVLDSLPGADEALTGQSAVHFAPDAAGQQWLYSAVPVPSVGWAVVVQRPATDALAVSANFRLWLLAAAALFGLGGLAFWLILVRRVMNPLSALATQHQALPTILTPPSRLSQRSDEIGGLARALHRLENDVTVQLQELHTLLETSNAVVGSLDPRAVAVTILRQVQRLINCQASAILVPDDDGVLRVLASEGRNTTYAEAVEIQPDDSYLPAARALREGRPIQIVAGGDEPFPPISLTDGFHAVLALPIISRHVGGVVLLVHRREARPFAPGEIDLLLTFANHATLAWEHAILYERSDEHLREVALDNARLYQQAMYEKQTLAAIMGSLNDGLILTNTEGYVLYANRGASILTGVPAAELTHSHIAHIHAALREVASDPDAYDPVASEGGAPWVVEIARSSQRQALALRTFDVRDEEGAIIGRGLLVRDVTREYELDRFKSTLLAAVGHEVRTPLAAIKGNASTLLQDDVTWTPADQRHFLQSISDESDRLAQLVSNLLDLARQDAGLLAVYRQPWPLPALLTNALQRLNPPLTDLRLDVPADLPLLYVDGPRIEVVLRNLLANAVAYGAKVVCVSAQVQATTVTVCIADDGPGIPAGDLPHVFERFYRAQGGMHQRSAGTGLGLAICKAFVEAHGGSVSVESGASGTTFRLSFDAFSPDLAFIP